MKSGFSRIQVLVERLGECHLSVEVKSWSDPDQPDGIGIFSIKPYSRFSRFSTASCLRSSVASASGGGLRAALSDAAPLDLGLTPPAGLHLRGGYSLAYPL